MKRLPPLTHLHTHDTSTIFDDRYRKANEGKSRGYPVSYTKRKRFWEMLKKIDPLLKRSASSVALDILLAGDYNRKHEDELIKFVMPFWNHFLERFSKELLLPAGKETLSWFLQDKIMPQMEIEVRGIEEREKREKAMKAMEAEAKRKAMAWRAKTGKRK